MKIPKGIFSVLIIIFIIAFVRAGFSQEDKKESTPQKKTITEKQKPDEKDLKSQEKKNLEEKKSVPSEDTQQKDDYDEAELLRESQRTFDRSISIFNTIATLIGVLIGLLTLIIIIAIAVGIFESRKWRAIIRRAERSTKRIEDWQNKAKQAVSNLNNDISKMSISDFVEKPPQELIEKLDEYSRRLNLVELFGLPIESGDYINRGFDLTNKKKYEHALEAFEKAIELDPKSFRAWLGKGNALHKLNKDEESLKASEKLIELKPEEAIAWSNKSASLIDLKRYEEALAAIKEALKRKPNYALAWQNKGTALVALKRYDESFEAYIESINRDSEIAGVWYNLACIFSVNKDRENMLTCLEKAIELRAKFKDEARKEEDFKDYWMDDEFRKITN